jgi:murein DD-endopeptidase MepM/ murein hydrolase activator NlpD
MLSGNRNINVRIIKNEVFGKEGTKPYGKTVTTHTNRQLLYSLVEMDESSESHSSDFLARSVLMNLEIPETSAIRNAQDRGISAFEISSSSNARKAFERLTDNIQYILNHEQDNTLSSRYSIRNSEFNRLCFGVLRFAILAFVLFFAADLWNQDVPAVKTPPQMEKIQRNIITHTFYKGESLCRFAKYAISKYRAVVPSSRMINRYLTETINIHNLNHPKEERIYNINDIPSGIKISFYPPECIQNENYALDAPVYEYFMSIVEADNPYITGAWGQYGSGGDSPHTGIDVAAPRGSKIIAPISGTVYNENSRKGGRITSIKADDFVFMFAHCSKRFFKTGDFIRKGQTIATVGMTGRTNGPHVHVGYGIRSPGRGNGLRAYKYTDPKYWVYRQTFLRNYKYQPDKLKPSYTSFHSF